jgi:hypothetical protein
MGDALSDANGRSVVFANVVGTGGPAALGNTARTGELIVNGASQPITFDGTGAWTS